MATKSWQGKVALVTGGSTGLGRAIAQALVDRGADVALAARDPDRLEATAAQLRQSGRQVLAVPTDVRRQDQVERMVTQTVQRFGRLDMLVNNAGRSARGEAIATSPEEFADMMDLNLIALVRCTRAAMPHLLAAQGHLVNIGSLAGKTAARYMGAYSATKFAMTGYSQQIRMELGPQGLHVLLVSPGPIARDEPRTYSAEQIAALPESAHKPGAGVKVSLLRPEKLAAWILDACDKRQPELVVPGRARLVFAISALWPSLGDWIVRKMS